MEKGRSSTFSRSAGGRYSLSIGASKRSMVVRALSEEELVCRRTSAVIAVSCSDGSIQCIEGRCCRGRDLAVS